MGHSLCVYGSDFRIAAWREFGPGAEHADAHRSGGEDLPGVRTRGQLGGDRDGDAAQGRQSARSVAGPRP
jgi:hypothetical protein